GLSVSQIPPLPADHASVVVGGPDPFVHIPTTGLSAIPGSLVTVPVLIDNADGLQEVQLTLHFDPTKVQVAPGGVQTGAVTDGSKLAAVSNPTDGTLIVDLLRSTPVQGAVGGSLLLVTLQVNPNASAGTMPLDLAGARLNAGGLTLTPQPVPGADPTD